MVTGGGVFQLQTGWTCILNRARVISSGWGRVGVGMLQIWIVERQKKELWRVTTGSLLDYIFSSIPNQESHQECRRAESEMTEDEARIYTLSSSGPQSSPKKGRKMQISPSNLL